MGVPAFYRWLSQKYPRIIQDCIEKYENDGSLPDASQPNPNAIEFDNLYLDMNGIIHPCCHPENGVEPKTDVEKFSAIMKYIERIFNIVRPRKLLFMAIDGVAPRAKMNQQRSRRFRAAQELRERTLEEQKLREEWRAQGRKVPDAEEKWDSNVITPGTPFMDNLAKYLRYFIHKKQQEDTAWKNIKVILSDASVPGEGEHKVMEHIRLQRTDRNHDPNTHHIIHGLDADLIMLALATHEPYFTILREVVFTKHRPTEKEKQQSQDKKPFQFLHINVLREYLDNEFMTGTNYARIPGGFDLERAIDDFIFLCFFAGNDFLPHLPSLDIRDGGIDTLLEIYRMLMPSMTGYITDNGNVNLERVERFLIELGRREDEFFRRKKSKEDAQKNREKRRREERETALAAQKRMKAVPVALLGGGAGEQANKDVAKAMKQALLGGGEGDGDGAGESERAPPSSAASTSEAGEGSAESVEESEAEKEARQAKEKDDFSSKLKDVMHEKNVVDAEDTVRLHEHGWKERYYTQKFGVPPSGDEGKELRDRLFKSYVEGLVWVMRYYYQGVASWGWYFPFHYAPFASDLCSIADLEITFEKGKPFSPFEQLLAVLPEASSHALPPSFAKYMKAEGSPISDFYPENFKVDMNGKKMAWMGVALLPFVDETRLKECAGEARKQMTLDERRRDDHGDNLLFTSNSHVLAPSILQYCYGEALIQTEKIDAQKWAMVVDEGKLLEEAKEAVKASVEKYVKEIDTEESGGFGGFLAPHVGAYRIDDDVPSPPDARGLFGVIPKNKVISACYRFPPERRHVPKLLPGLTMPTRQLTQQDLEEAMYSGRGGRRRRMDNDDARREAMGVVGRMVRAGFAAQPMGAPYGHPGGYNFAAAGTGALLPGQGGMEERGGGGARNEPFYASSSYVPGGGLSRGRQNEGYQGGQGGGRYGSYGDDRGQYGGGSRYGGGERNGGGRYGDYGGRNDGSYQGGSRYGGGDYNRYGGGYEDGYSGQSQGGNPQSGGYSGGSGNGRGGGYRGGDGQERRYHPYGNRNEAGRGQASRGGQGRDGRYSFR